MVTKLGLATLMKWSQLEDKPLEREMKNRRRGGAGNPHDRLYALIRQYVSKKKTIREIFSAISKIEPEKKRKSFRSGFKNFLRIYGDRVWKLLPSPRLPYPGRQGVLRISARSHLTLVEGARRYHIVLWNNNQPPLSSKAALIGALLLSEIYPSGDDDVRFEVADLKNNVWHSLRSDEISDRISELLTFLDGAERRYRLLETS